MLRTRIIKEEKYFRISSDSLYVSGHGYSDINKGKIYYEEPFISAEDCKEKMVLAMIEYEEMDGWCRPEEPRLEIYWKTIEETINPTEVES